LTGKKKDVNNMLVGLDWPKTLVDGGQNKVTSFQLNKYDYAATHLDTNGDANMKNIRGRKRI
jgi:hypothetical protein